MSSFLTQRAAQNSPSIAMEKGTYRIRRGPLLRNPENFTFPSNQHDQRLQDTVAPTLTAKNESQAISANLISHEKRLVLLVIFLMFATCCCFATAYYLFTTSSPSLVNLSPPTQSGLTKVYSPSPRVRPDEKLLSYLPHSGFHNQRIALENALVLARLLNRTLLVPPIRFGHRAIPYRNFTVLQRLLDADYTAYLCELSKNATSRNNTTIGQDTFLGFLPLPERCTPRKKRKHAADAYVPWGWITDFDFIKEFQPTIQTFGSTRFWLSSLLDPRVDEILVIPDTSKYQYRFSDDIILDPSSNLRGHINATHSEDITINSLVNHPAKLIQLGSLFGSRRLKLSDPTHRATRKQVRQYMSLGHPLLRKSSVDIATQISGPGSKLGFLGVHLRCNDSYFLETATEHSRMLWWKLVYGILGLPIERARQLELDYFTMKNTSWSLPSEQFIRPSSYPVHLSVDFRSLASGADSLGKCKGKLHTDPDLERLNVPVFIATDAEDPYTNDHVSLFRQAFPCVFFLGDFPHELEPITSLRDPIGEAEIGSMLVPFLDAMVVARAARVVGTPHSTFSWYVQDVLWRLNHGLDIEERN